MKIIRALSVMMGVLAGATATGAEKKAETLKSFTSSDSPISKDVKVAEDNAWLVEASGPEQQVFPLFEIPEPGAENCMIFYRAQLKGEKVQGQAYLEMWCRFPGKGEFFSRGLNNPLSGSTNWASFETPFVLKKGEKPDLIKFNLVVKGTGKVWIRNIELLKGPLPHGK